jgi:hypothetical protein
VVTGPAERSPQRLQQLGDDDLPPWAASPADLQRMQASLDDLAQCLPKRQAGVRFAHLLRVKKKKRMHQYHMLGGPIGERPAAVAVTYCSS